MEVHRLGEDPDIARRYRRQPGLYSDDLAGALRMANVHPVTPPAQMERLMREFFEACMDKFFKKNRAYAQTDTTSDALDNFWSEAAETGIRPDQVWNVLAGKHRRTLASFLRTGEAPAPVHRVLRDIINYHLILYCLYVAMEKIEHSEAVNDPDE